MEGHTSADLDFSAMANPTKLASGGFGLGGLRAHVTVPSVVGPTVALILVFNRVYWRMRLSRTIGLDNHLILLSLVRKPAFTPNLFLNQKSVLIRPGSIVIPIRARLRQFSGSWSWLWISLSLAGGQGLEDCDAGMYNVSNSDITVARSTMVAESQTSLTSHHHRCSISCKSSTKSPSI